MKTTTLLLGAALALMSVSPARATTMYGALSNFDAINDTGGTTHGFEITLEGCNPSDVSYLFGTPYNRYGDPTVTSSSPGVTTVTYAAHYDSGSGTWDAGTSSGTLADTGGHSLFNGSYPLYPGDVPGDHFGVGLNVNPTNTTYRWLVDGGGGTLTPFGTNVKIPAPVLTLVQPVNPAAPPVVQAALPAPANENDSVHPLFGEAIWAKVFTIEVQNPEPVELNDLVLGNPAVSPDTEIETEIEWQILQAGKAGFDARGDEVNLGDGHESVTRRYDFYRYIGRYDEDGEALDETPTATDDPNYPSGFLEVGDFIGRQNVAANFAPLVPEPSTLALFGVGALGLLGYGLRRRKQTA